MDAIFQSFVSLGWWEILVTICNTLITFLIVKKFLFKPVRKMIAAREDEVTRSLAEYRRNARPASAEELHEMRAAFGEGQTVVNILTGERYSL